MAILAAGQREKTNKIPALRGSILSADNFPLVTNKTAYLLFINPQKIKSDLEGAIKNLVPFLAEEEASSTAKQKELEAILVPRDKVWVALKHKVTDEEKKKIENLQIPGIGFEEETVRFYPEASMAAQLLGFVGSSLTGEPTGYFGLEGYYNMELKGRQGTATQEEDVFDRPILTGFFGREEQKNGKNLELSLDRSVQLIVEDELAKAIEKYGAKNGWVIVMEPTTGSILAMASIPRYDPTNFFKYPLDSYKNPPISEGYEPGSTFKVLVMAAAVNENLIKEDTKCDICDGPYKIDKYTIETWNHKYYPGQTMTEVLEHSDNVGMIFVARKLGKTKLLDYLNKFGIGEKTGIDLQDETSFPLKAVEQWSDVDLATAGFGQGLAVSGIQMIRAVASIANGGNLVEPHIAAKIVGENKSIQIKPKIIRNVLKPQTAEKITAMMVNAVSKGEAKWAKPAGFQIAGKTGTAQIPVAGHYDESKTIASFVGFAPAKEPKFLILTYLREPTSSPWGSETAAPLFFAICKKLLLYYGIQPGNDIINN